MMTEAMVIVCLAFCTCSLGEALTWLLVYRTEKYKNLMAEIERSTKKLENNKSPSELLDKGIKKRKERDGDRLKAINQDLSFVKMKSMIAIGFVFTALLGVFNSMYEGEVVALLPFSPPWFIRGLTHRSLKGENFEECSFIFLYILSTMFIRQNMQKLLGFTPTRSALRQGAGGMFSQKMK